MRTADLRYFGQAYEVRVAVPERPGRPRTCSPRWPQRFHDEHRALYGYDFRDDPSQQVEWVNLRVTGVGPIQPGPRLRAIELGRRRRVDGQARQSGSATRSLLRPRRRVRRHPGPMARPTCAPATSSAARRSSRSSARPSRSTPASPSGSTPTATSSSRRSRPDDRRRAAPARARGLPRRDPGQPGRPADRVRARRPPHRRGRGGGPDPRRDRPGHPRLGRDGGRDGHRPHLAAPR